MKDRVNTTRDLPIDHQIEKVTLLHIVGKLQGPEVLPTGTLPQFVHDENIGLAPAIEFCD